MKPIALFVLLLALAACGGTSSKPAPAKAPPVYFHVDPSTAGAISGSIRFAGKRPAARRISMDAEQDCQKLHKTPVYEELVKTGKAGGLANVFVYVKSGLEGKSFEPPTTTVVIDQQGCQFAPRVVALRAGQTLEVKNSDPVSHNIHPMPRNNRDWNQQQPPGSPDLRRRFGYPEVMIPVKCNIHNWMRTYIGVLQHPYFAVTGDDGAFTFDPLPPGRYTVAAWHETLGEASQEVEVKAGARAPVAFTFRPPAP